MEICYGLATSDHIPAAMVLNVETVPLLLDPVNIVNSDKLNWANLSNKDIDSYSVLPDNLLNQVVLPRVTCLNMNCTDPQHAVDLCDSYDNIIKALHASAGSFCSHKKVLNIKPGWNEYVAEHHAAAREAFKLWTNAGRPRQGDVFEYKKQANARYKYALCHIKNNENAIRADLLARKPQNNNYADFWKAINSK